MTDFWFYFWITYGVVSVISMVPLARYLAKLMEVEDSFELAMAAMLAICCAPLWPLGIPMIWLMKILQMDAQDARR